MIPPLSFGFITVVYLFSGCAIFVRRPGRHRIFLLYYQVVARLWRQSAILCSNVMKTGTNPESDADCIIAVIRNCAGRLVFESNRNSAPRTCYTSTAMSPSTNMSVDKLTITFLVDNCIEWFYLFSVIVQSLKRCFQDDQVSSRLYARSTTTYPTVSGTRYINRSPCDRFRSILLWYATIP
jgi:hypothetical protein